jgi:alpha-galactosidase/6-phospho-beta-glucosidase family protein
MPQTKIVLIGAASASFGVDTLAGILAQGDRLRGSTVTLVDLDEPALDVITELARRASDEYGAGLEITSTTDRREALVDAEFVVVSVEVDHYPAWARDWELTRELGPRSYSENGGPGGLSHGLRSIPTVVDICRDVAGIAPEALVLNYSNPMSRVCLAAARYTNARVVGLCHQIGHAYHEVGRVLGWITAPDGTEEEIAEAGAVAKRLGLRACGLNHLTFITQMWDRETDRDLYPTFRERLAQQPREFAPLGRRVNDIFGLYPTGGDLHISEYFGWAHELCDVEPPFAFWDARDKSRKARIASAHRGELALTDLFARANEFQLDRAVDVIMATLTGSDQLELAVNVVNDGAIPDLPSWAIVEVPAVVGADGIHPLPMPGLTRGVTAMLNQQIVVQERAVEAAMHGDRTAALQSLLLDPVSGGRLRENEQLLDKLLDAHRPILERFAA